jgi:hypothetical protein
MSKRIRVNHRIARQLGEHERSKRLFAELLDQHAVCFPKKGDTLDVPTKHGVYIIFDKAGRVLHVGRTYRARCGLLQRLNGHLNGQSSFVGTFLRQNKGRLRKGYNYKYLVVGHNRRRALLEHYAIGVLCPAHLGVGESIE